MGFFNNISFVKPQISLHLFKNATIVDSYTDNRRFSINTHDIPKLLNLKLSTPYININSQKIIGILFSFPHTYYFLHYKPQIRTIHLENPPTSFDFFYKDLLFILKFNSKSFENFFHVFTFEKITGQLYPAPLFNVTKSGSMCLGSINYKNINDPETFIDTVFFNSVFTHTSFVPSKISNSGKLSEYLYKHKKSGWNFKDLEPYKNLSEIISSGDLS